MELGSCRLCGLDQLLPLFTLSDNEGHPVEIRICLRCFVLVPRYDRGAVTAEEMTSHQARYHDAQWSEIPAEEAANLRNELRGLIDFYRAELGEPSHERVIFDVGAGRGALVAALRDAGYDARGCEPSAALAHRARVAYGLTAEQMVASSADELFERIRRDRVPVGHFFLWHVIEHVADPLALMRQIASVLPVGHCVFVQAPCLKEPWLYPEHLILFTEPAVHAVARNSGCEVASINYDHKLAFVTFVLRRTDGPLPQAWVPIPSFTPDHRAALEVMFPRLRAELEESRAHAATMVAMANERMRGIEGQSKIIDDRDKWIADLMQRLGRRDAELDRANEAAAKLRDDLGRAEHAKNELEHVVANLTSQLRNHEKRLIPERVEKMFAKAWPRNRG